MEDGDTHMNSRGKRNERAARNGEVNSYDTFLIAWPIHQAIGCQVTSVHPSRRHRGLVDGSEMYTASMGSDSSMSRTDAPSFKIIEYIYYGLKQGAREQPPKWRGTAASYKRNAVAHQARRLGRHKTL